MEEEPSVTIYMDDLLIYYKLPKLLKKRCFELRKLSVEQEALTIKYRLERLAICRKYSEKATQHLQDSCEKKARLAVERNFEDEDSNDDTHFGREKPNSLIRRAPPHSSTFPLSPFNANPLLAIASKAADIKAAAESQTESWMEESVSLRVMNLEHSMVLRKVVSHCENKCNELLTKLANIDFELHEYEDSLVGYHREIEESMVRLNKELTALYERRSQIINKEALEPDCKLTEADLQLKLPADGLDIPMLPEDKPDYLKLDSEEWRLRRSSAKFYTPDSELQLVRLVKGLPFFWHNVLRIALEPFRLISERDTPMLLFLRDVRYYYDTERWNAEPPLLEGPDTSQTERYQSTNSDHRSQLLLFHFDENPYFSNRVLMKCYHIDKSRQSGKEMFDGFYVTSKEGCSIDWIAQRPAEPSFFDFFDKPQGLDQRDRIIAAPFRDSVFKTSLDYGVFVRFRDFIAPHPITAYSRGNIRGFDKQTSKRSNYYWKRLFG